MKKALLLFGIAFLALSFRTQAQSPVLGKVTKITAATSTSGTIVLEDTTATLPVIITYRRGDLHVVVHGTTTGARVRAYDKGGRLVFTSGIGSVRVVGAGNGTASPTAAQKVTYLIANSY
ncbi:hypothetical protein [Larkinella soli]|uniref:hypothetical protein n=1 Tax=Larkinella soli TaxID=1770527 RepID=UPI000FFC4B51|nr:hypothetical protein [Larkinella soli]